MIRSVLRKLILAATMCIALVVICIGVAGYLAFRSPSFYAELVARQPRAGAAEAAEQRLEQMRRDFVQWQSRSLAIQKRQAVDAMSAGAGQPHDGELADVAGEDVHTFRLSEDDLNALLASRDFGFGSDELHDPRIRFDDGKAMLAFTLATPAGNFVLSAAFEPRPADDGTRLRVARVSVGRLALPVSTLSSWVPKRESRLHGDLYLDATGPLPELVLRPGRVATGSARPKSIECTQGELIVRLASPTLQQD